MECGFDLQKLGLHGSFLGTQHLRGVLLRGSDKGGNLSWTPLLLQARKMAHSLILLLNLLKCCTKFFLHYSGTRVVFSDRMKAPLQTVSISPFAKDLVGSDGKNDFDVD